MRILFIVATLFVLAGCESMDFTTVSVNSGYSNYYPTNHISYTLGFYSGSHYNGYRVHGSHGQRYYYAPRRYAHHQYYSAPIVVRPRHYSPPHHSNPPRHRDIPHQVRNNRHDDRDDRRRRHRNQH